MTLSYVTKGWLKIIIASVVYLSFNIVLYAFTYWQISNLLVYWLSYFFFWGGISVVGTFYAGNVMQREYTVWAVVGTIGLAIFFLSRYFNELIPILGSCFGFPTGTIIYTAVWALWQRFIRKKGFPLPPWFL